MLRPNQDDVALGPWIIAQSLSDGHLEIAVGDEGKLEDAVKRAQEIGQRGWL